VGVDSEASAREWTSGPVFSYVPRDVASLAEAIRQAMAAGENAS
jgi:hypothetical protein